MSLVLKPVGGNFNMSDYNFEGEIDYQLQDKRKITVAAQVNTNTGGRIRLWVGFKINGVYYNNLLGDVETWGDDVVTFQVVDNLNMSESQTCTYWMEWQDRQYYDPDTWHNAPSQTVTCQDVAPTIKNVSTMIGMAFAGLSVTPEEKNGQEVTVEFYDQATENQIGSTKTGVKSGEICNQTWMNLTPDTNYSWCAKITDPDGNVVWTGWQDFTTLN